MTESFPSGKINGDKVLQSVTDYIMPGEYLYYICHKNMAIFNIKKGEHSVKIEHMLSFLALEHYKNFSTAAESRFLSQSVLSKHIMAMEKELDTKLFERGSRQVRLTPIGERIFKHVQNITREYDLLQNAVWNYQTDNRQMICISTLYDLSQYGLADLIIQFEQLHPGIHIETRETTHETMYYNLDNGRSLCALGFSELWNNLQSYPVIPLRKEKLALVFHKSHPLATVNTPSLGEARDYRFCFPKEDQALYNYFLHACLNVGFMPRLTLSDVRFSTIRRYVSEGMRLTITTISYALNIFTSDDYFIIPLNDIAPLTFSLMTKYEDLSPAYMEFIEHIKLFFKTL